MVDILMPALSPTMEEGTLAKWLVKVGDSVEAGQVIAEIETDKATMEVEAVDEGEVSALLVDAGTEGVKVNAPIARLKGDGEGAAPATVSTGEGQPTPGASATDARAARDEGTDRVADSAGAPVQGSSGGKGGGPVRTANETNVGVAPPPQPAAPTAPPRSGEPEQGATSSSSPASGGGGREADGGGDPTSKGARVFASPLARRLAAQKGVDLAALAGSGPHGRVIAADVEAARPGAAPARDAPVAAADRAAPGSAGSGPQPPTPRTLAQMGIPDGSYDLVPLDGMRRTVARRMTESFRDIPHFPLTIDLEIDRLLDARVRINRALEKTGAKVSVNDMVIKAAAAALKAEPEANASYTPEGLAMHHDADIAVAVAVDGGLITPIVRRAQTKSLAEIAVEMKDLAERARTKRLKPEEFQGGTFSVSNLGMMGIKSFSSILNAPQGCILSVGAGEKRPVVRGDALAIATVMTVTLTCDHRVVDGAIGARWLAAFRGYVEDPITLLA